MTWGSLASRWQALFRAQMLAKGDRGQRAGWIGVRRGALGISHPRRGTWRGRDGAETGRRRVRKGKGAASGARTRRWSPRQGGQEGRRKPESRKLDGESGRCAGGSRGRGRAAKGADKRRMKPLAGRACSGVNLGCGSDSLQKFQNSCVACEHVHDVGRRKLWSNPGFSEPVCSSRGYGHPSCPAITVCCASAVCE